MRLAWDGFSNPPKAINWQYASARQNAVFSTTAYCPLQTVCPNASSRYIGSGDYKTYCTKSGSVCISPRHQSDVRIGAHAHGVEIGAHGHPLHTECSHAHSLV
ncbi:hypothetical protein S513_16130 [Salmonella enterica subsp. enterica serovar Newport]|nr:hypothetical protein [Salmonella enterica subsp. enterica serovar Newport]